MSPLSFTSSTPTSIETPNTLTDSQLASLNLLLLPGISFFDLHPDRLSGGLRQIGGAGLQPGQLHPVRDLFPHLIAGPIVHHKDLMPQFASTSNLRFRPTTSRSACSSLPSAW